MWWKLLLAAILVVIIWVLYSNDYSAQKSMDSVKTNAGMLVDKAKAAMGTAPAPNSQGSDVPAPTAPTQGSDAAAAPKTEGFCPKLMQRHGFCNAGESMNQARGTFYDRAPMAALPTRGLKFEGMSDRVPPLGDVATQTQWGGYMHRSALPNF